MQRIHIDQILPILEQFGPSTGYSTDMLRWGFEHMLSHWNPVEFEAMMLQEIPSLSYHPHKINECVSKLTNLETSLSFRVQLLDDLGIRCARHVMMVSASTVPSAAFQDVMLTLMLPLEITWRPASNLYNLCRALNDLLLILSPDFASRLHILKPNHDESLIANALCKCDVINVSGSQETIKLYEQIIESNSVRDITRPKFIKHGHRVSCIAIRKDDLMLSENDYLNMAIDACIWDQSGCLSPKCMFVEGDFESCKEIGKSLIHAMNAWGAKFPATGPDIAERSLRNSALVMTVFDGNEVIRGQNLDAIVIHRQGLGSKPLFFGRTLNIFPVDNGIEAANMLSPYGQAFCSRNQINAEDRRKLETWGYNYFCTFGKMQDPPLTWLHDQIGTLRPLFF